MLFSFFHLLSSQVLVKISTEIACRIILDANRTVRCQSNRHRDSASACAKSTSRADLLTANRLLPQPLLLLGGAEVLVAVRGPSPGEGGGKKPSMKDIRLDHQEANTAAPSDAI